MFWHHLWYSDTSYALFMRQDELTTKLIHVYLRYGWLSPKNFFWNQHWYKSEEIELPKTQEPKLFYRWITVQGDNEYDLYTYQLRIPGPEFFQTQVHVLRYDNWFVINFYWFQPDKTQKKRANRLNSTYFTHVPHLNKSSLFLSRKYYAALNAFSGDDSDDPFDYEF